MQQVSFDNAREKAIGASLAYHFGYAFGQYGLSGLSVGAWYTQGFDAINPVTGLGIADRRELAGSSTTAGFPPTLNYPRCGRCFPAVL
jgi:hypothetical protein